MFVTLNDTFFQMHGDSLSVNWDYFDPESGIDRFELVVYEMRYGSKNKFYPAGKLKLLVTRAVGVHNLGTGTCVNGKKEVGCVSYVSSSC